jgi:fumarate reductase subunit D
MNTPNDSQHFTVSRDGLVTGITTFVVVLLLGILVGFTWIGADILRSPNQADYVGWIMILSGIGSVALVVLVTWSMAPPTGYRVEPGRLVIERIARAPVTLACSEITSVEAGDPKDVWRRALRLWGNGGLWGITGRYTSRGLGRFEAYATRRDRCVVIRRRNGTPWLLTPDDPDALIAALTPAAGE